MIRSLCGSGRHVANPRFASEVSRPPRKSLCLDLRERNPLKLKHIDNEQEFDWGRASPDYAKYRSGYPESFYEVLAALGIGKPRQRILDLGTGTGVLARAFAKRGALVTGVDISANQIAE